MESIRAKLAVWAKDRALVRTAAAIGTVVLLLIICLCISIHIRSNIQMKYSNTIYHLQEQTYQHLIRMTELFGRVDDPNVDVRYKLIPQLKAQYTAVAALNAVLTDSCGKEHAVLSSEQADAFEYAFEEYSSAYSQGIATGLARADMADCIQSAQALIDLHYASPKDEADKVVVINGISGEVKEK